MKCLANALGQLTPELYREYLREMRRLQKLLPLDQWRGQCVKRHPKEYPTK